MFNKTDDLAINTIRTLSIDAIDKANSGHPGLPMGAAPFAYTLWTQFMNHNPKNPDWFDRDRFVLSAGHGSMLLYSLLHLSGYDLSLDEIKNFRQWGSKTPGHPEFKHTKGVEATTGPLGQGIGMAVGMAMAEKHLSAKFNRDDFNVVDHYTYTLCGDGDLMEGVSSEAASLAGHLKLDKLIVLYDSNDISLDGDLDRSFSESVKKRFESYNWQYIRVDDGNDVAEVADAIKAAKADSDRPTMIEIKTVIGFGSPNRAGTSKAHGAPLGNEESILAKKAYQWEAEEAFYVPDEVYKRFEELVVDNGAEKEKEWNEKFENYKSAYPELAQELEDAMNGKLADNWDKDLPVYEEGKSLASRASSGEVLNAISKTVPTLFGGSADLAGSNNTMMKDEADFTPETPEGRNIWFGVREFAMGTALNGMALHGGLRVYGGTFFVFSDYVRPAIRLSALMGVPVTYVFTHDSIAVGEDGPTHEPIEQLPSLRAMPGLSVIRPADGNEVAAAWKLSMEAQDHPTTLVLTRQGLPTMPGSAENAYEGVKKGAYVLSPSEKGEADVLLLASGSEVGLAYEAQQSLREKNIDAAVVSMPSWDRFEQQSADYKQSVLPKNVKKRFALEMASPLGWERYTGDEGEVLGIDTFGASAPGGTVLEEYGFTVENVVKRVEALLQS
ncbi:transketolase [Jeotgalibacillus haloalkalitolerans]|uniref:Transketolase n=1 Tax=Jeotgalibacillus haloalkalitolerans TaxID=3104292 RepID=A0ABU5KL68_9BACL|nr:transketolase [Jeotgalibacillus sp. HH7-29]MDZ5711823.1 transketolase [Jeotgalibacillus sp. HH7-29]